MTADLSFQIRKKENVIKIPKAALRFYPPDKKNVHPDDQKILEGVDFDSLQNNDEDDGDDVLQPASERVDAGKKAKKRHVWKLEGELLRAVEVQG